MASGKSQYRFQDYRLDGDAGWLRRGKQEVELPPKAFQVLRYLIEHRDRLVPKQELMQAVWKDTFVTDDALVQAVTAIRRALGDEAGHPRYIRTKARMGYQFTAAVEAGEPASTATTAADPIARGTARRFFLLIQVGYLVLYSIALLNLQEAAEVLAAPLDRWAGAGSVSFPGIAFLALGGVAVRLYLLTAVAFDHPETGCRFRRLFPALFLLDLLWALSPLLLVEKTGVLLALALVPVLIYAPFAQRTLIRSAYPVFGGVS